MSALDLIIEWAAKDLSDWQSDAVRRLLTQDSLTEKDKEEIFNILKRKYELNKTDTNIPTPIPLKHGDVSGSINQSVHITIKSIQNLQNVNAILNGATLPFGHEGLTVIYGENGVGKSGYARVLKKACHARDNKEIILSNVFSNKGQQTAKGEFKVAINGKDMIIPWKDGQEPSEVLSNISVFDSKCARLIINDNNEAVYLPYGAFVFSDLVALLREFRDKLIKEKPQVEILNFPDITSNTKAGLLLANLSCNTKEEVITEFAKWTDDDQTKLTDVEKSLLEARNPSIEAKRKRNIKLRIIKLKQAIENLYNLISIDKQKSYKELINQYIAAEKSFEIAKKEFDFSDMPLLGVGGKEWQILYEAAKKYSLKSAYPDIDFPNLSNNSLCVLCMQKLESEAKKRMEKFKKYMEDETKKILDKQIMDLENEIQKLEMYNLNIQDDYKDALDEINSRNNVFSKNLILLIVKFDERPNQIINSLKSKNVNGIDKINNLILYKNEDNEKELNLEYLYTETTSSLINIIGEIENEALKIEKTEDQNALKALEINKEELISRKHFTARKDKIIEYLKKLKLIKKYEDCIVMTDHRSITTKGKNIVSLALTPQLQKYLEEELTKVGVSHLPLNLRGSDREGRTKYQLELKNCQLPKNTNLTEVLSEGEQSVVSIAGFLAELRTGEHKCPIVFDDPVNSLDHRYRFRIAKRLAEESLERQVIVFTHDIAFLNELEDQIILLTTSKFTSHTIIKPTETTVGKFLDGLPWHAMSVPERIEYLEEELFRIALLNKTNLNLYNREAAQLYGLMRETWEAMIEEELFNKVVRKHLGHTQMLRLSDVIIQMSDYDVIDINYSKCSTWMTGHQKSKALDQNRPNPDEIKKDILAIEEFKKLIRKRKKETKEQREKIAKDKKTEVG